MQFWYNSLFILISQKPGRENVRAFFVEIPDQVVNDRGGRDDGERGGGMETQGYEGCVSGE
jgi:hypothetical protein